MKKLLLALLVVSATAPAAWAKCPEGLALKAIGSPANTTASTARNTDAITTVGVDVYALTWACTSSACSGALYDSDGSIATSTDYEEGDIEYELAGVASGGDHVEFDAPLTFNEGIGVQGANLSGVVAYGCVQR